jgi:hypothetical protein
VAKDKKLKVPKRIAGIKVPKKIRKPVNKALAIAENPATRDLAVAALTAAAAALAKKGAEAAARRPQQPGEPGTDPDGAGKLTDVVIACALDGARRLIADPARRAPSDPDVVDAPGGLDPSSARAGAKRSRAGATGPVAPQDA